MALCQQGGWTTEMRATASNFEGWEEEEAAETPAEPGTMQPEAQLQSKASMAFLTRVRVVSCTSQSRRLDGNVGMMVCPAACCHVPHTIRWAPKPD